MFKHATTLAFSLSLVTLAASPALAQTRRTAEPAPAPAPTRVAAPTLAASEMTKPRVEFTLMGGYRFMHGVNQSLGSTVSNSNGTKVDNAVAPPRKDYTRNTNGSDTAPVSNSLEHGFSVSGSATYWLDPSFGLGLDYTFAHTGAKLDAFHKLALEPMDLNKLDEAAVPGTLTENKVNTTSFNTGNVGVTTSNVPATVGTAGNADYKEFQVTTARITSFPATVNFTADNAGAVGAFARTFINSKEAIPTGTAADAPTNKYTAKGKIGETLETSTTMHMADALTKTVIGSNARGELHLLAGVTIPMITSRRVNTSMITGEDGTGAATQKVEHVDSGTATNNFTQDIAVEAKHQDENVTTSTMVGPMIGLGGTFKVNDGFRLYGKIGYAPAMYGSGVSSRSTTASSKVVTTYTAPGSTSGQTEGSTTVENSTSTKQSDSHFVASAGAATSFVLGARFSLGGSLGLNVEGVNQTVAGLGYTGVNAGVSLGF